MSGGNGSEDTPVPIPNTAVKPAYAEDTWSETARENRELPDSFFKNTLGVFFYWAHFLHS